jgi:hypothetical protein
MKARPPSQRTTRANFMRDLHVKECFGQLPNGSGTSCGLTERPLRADSFMAG